MDIGSVCASARRMLVVHVSAGVLTVDDPHGDLPWIPDRTSSNSLATPPQHISLPSAVRATGYAVRNSSYGAFIEFEEVLAQAGGHLLDPLLFGAGQGQGVAEFDHVGVGQRIDVGPR
jgi:hypothetical protein